MSVNIDNAENVHLRNNGKDFKYNNSINLVNERTRQIYNANNNDLHSTQRCALTVRNNPTDTLRQPFSFTSVQTKTSFNVYNDEESSQHVPQKKTLQVNNLISSNDAVVDKRNSLIKSKNILGDVARSNNQAVTSRSISISDSFDVNFDTIKHQPDIPQDQFTKENRKQRHKKLTSSSTAFNVFLDNEVEKNYKSIGLTGTDSVKEQQEKKNGTHMLSCNMQLDEKEIHQSVIQEKILEISKEPVQNQPRRILTEAVFKGNLGISQHPTPTKSLIAKEEDGGTTFINEQQTDYIVTNNTTVALEKRNDLSKRLFVEEHGFHIYNDEILDHLKQLEQLNGPKPRYMERQRDLNYNMRMILVDWLVEVAEEYKLHTQTLFLTVSFIDRFLSTMSVVKAKLQLLGTASMFVAAKCEEIYPPDVNEFVYITDDTYTTRQVLRMEYLILKVLQFEVAAPTSYSFILYLSGALRLTDKEKYLATYLCELTLVEGDPYLKYKSSVVACASIAVARKALRVTPWPDDFAQLTGYCLLRLKNCIDDLNVTHKSSSSLQYKAVFNKYSSAKYHKVSSIKPQSLDASEEHDVHKTVDDDFQV